MELKILGCPRNHHDDVRTNASKSIKNCLTNHDFICGCNADRTTAIVIIIILLERRGWGTESSRHLWDIGYNAT